MTMNVNKNREKMKLYCDLLRNDHEFERETLVQLWMEYSSDQVFEEDIYEKYFDSLIKEKYILFSRIDNLTGRNLYKRVGQSKDISTGVMRTIYKDDHYTVLECEDANGDKSRHLSLVSDCFSETTIVKLQEFNVESIRTLLILNGNSPLNEIPSYMFLILGFLRALDLSRSDIVELPRSIGNVTRLHYLDLSCTLIKTLPETIDQLIELQTLKLQGCKHLYELPEGIKKLASLRHLDIDVLGQLSFLPKGIGSLTELCTLSAFIVDDSEEGSNIKELRYLNKLSGSFCISGLENVRDIDDVEEAALQEKTHLTDLQLRWSDLKLYDTQDQQDAYNVVASLKLNEGLQELQIICYPGLQIPAWKQFREHQNLVRITLLNCNNTDLSLPLGQLPNLQYLSIVHMNKVTKIDSGFRGGADEATHNAFPKLEMLEIDCMFELKAWIDVLINKDFQSLAELIIKQCPKLNRLHFLAYLQKLKYLEINGCTKLECLSDTKMPNSLKTLIIDDCPSLKEKCLKEDWEKINHIPDICIDLQDIKRSNNTNDDEDNSSITDIGSTSGDVREQTDSASSSRDSSSPMLEQEQKLQPVPLIGILAVATYILVHMIVTPDSIQGLEIFGVDLPDSLWEFASSSVIFVVVIVMLNKAISVPSRFHKAILSTFSNGSRNAELYEVGVDGSSVTSLGSAAVTMLTHERVLLINGEKPGLRFKVIFKDPSNSASNSAFAYQRSTARTAVGMISK